MLRIRSAILNTVEADVHGLRTHVHTETEKLSVSLRVSVDLRRYRKRFLKHREMQEAQEHAQSEDAEERRLKVS